MVKGRISLRAQALGLDLLLHCPQRPMHRGQVFLGSPARRQLCQLDLQRFACLQHLGQPAASLDQLRQRFAEAARPAEEDPLTVTDVHKSLGLQDDHRLPDRRPADAQLASQFPLGRKSVARRHARLPDKLA